MERAVRRAQALVRFLSLIFAVLAACLVALDKQTKTVFLSVERTATYKDLKALQVVVIIEAVVAGYQFVQLVKCLIGAKVGSHAGTISSCCKPSSHWVCFFLDQVAAYISLGGTSAAIQACFFAVTGNEAFQWSKLCNMYTRFCYIVAGGLFCGLVASLFAAAAASISAFHLFRLFSPHKWFTLKQGRERRADAAKS